MKKNFIIVAVIMALYAAAMNLCVSCVSSNMERGFTRRYGSSGYLSRLNYRRNKKRNCLIKRRIEKLNMDYKKRQKIYNSYSN